MTQNPDDIVLAHTYDTDWQAHLAKGLLAEHGIESIINNEIFASIYPIGFNSIGGVRLMVRLADLQRAREILAQAHIVD
ncbi:MAG: DUF2007 domain-containing protein [Bacteroidales bacterium]|nr:DUF2007 domain-containing protein [Bacteroidales bacterium]